MGLLGKIKNVLFEEEEIEIPVFKKEEKKEVKKEQTVKPVRKATEPVKTQPRVQEKPKVVKEVKEDNERETFKTEPTFQFPVFDENEFAQAPTRTRTNKSVSSKSNSNNRSKIDFGRFEEPKKPKEEKKKFVPSPVISPVFGVLDKNYVKKDISKKLVKEKVVNIDDVRNKAYGLVEEQIENGFTDKTVPIKEKPEKTITDLLIDSSNEEIEVEDEKTTIDKQGDTLDVLDEINNDIKKDSLEDTLESDLFNLIDSMYTNKEDE